MIRPKCLFEFEPLLGLIGSGAEASLRINENAKFHAFAKFAKAAGDFRLLLYTPPPRDGNKSEWSVSWSTRL